MMSSQNVEAGGMSLTSHSRSTKNHKIGIDQNELLCLLSF